MHQWDENKNVKNIEKHGVSFQTASRIFDGFVLTRIDDRVDYGEIREISIGHIAGIVFLTVVHTDRSGIRRLISARTASRSERKRYEQEIRKRTQP